MQERESIAVPLFGIVCIRVARRASVTLFPLALSLALAACSSSEPLDGDRGPADEGGAADDGGAAGDRIAADSACFPSGVAAGDFYRTPDHSWGVMLWAKAADETETPVTVRFDYGTEEDFVETDDRCKDVEVTDATVPAKHEVTGLLGGTQYYYRASYGSCDSPVSNECAGRGKFRTPHADGQHGLRFGVSSCFQGNLRPFESIKNVPDRDLHFFVALGDTVYADNAGATTLGEFRDQHTLAYSATSSPADNRFAQARASTAFFATIDDHEVVDNFAGGAPPTTITLEFDVEEPFTRPFCETEPCWSNYIDQVGDEKRFEAQFINETDLFNDALQAFVEYNPVRERCWSDFDGDRDCCDPVESCFGGPNGGEVRRANGKRDLYRYQTFGTDAAIFVLDARSFRDAPPLNLNQDWDLEIQWRIGRTMLGDHQFYRLRDDLARAEDAGITWKFVLIPQPIQHLDPLTGVDRFPGYARERAKVLEFIESECITNVVFISGDIHGTVVNNLVYEPTRPEIRRYSASWDISTGPVAYEEPFGPKLVKILEKVRSVEGYHDTNFVEDRDEVAQELLDDRVLGRLLLRYPQVGLDATGPRGLLSGLAWRQTWNDEIPLVEPGGPYLVGHTLGWTEFEIHPETQDLTVTTYGTPLAGLVSRDHDPLNPECDQPDPPPDTQCDDQPPWVMSQFRVAPVAIAPACAQCQEEGDPCLLGDDDKCCSKHCYRGLCSPDECLSDGRVCALGDDDKCCGKSCYRGRCSSGECLDNGRVCAVGDDDKCCSGSCYRGLCSPDECLIEGRACLVGEDDRCCSGSCYRGLCSLSGECLDNGRLCLAGDDAKCCNGRCVLGACRSCIPKDGRCSESADCCSNSCRRFRLLKYCD